MCEVEVYVKLKTTVADPQGLAVKHALESLGYNNLKQVRVGKLITLEVENDDDAAVKEQVTTMCEKLLANPVIEDYYFKIKK
jgi:phosphoribosylformylglycinamidine synthase